MQMLGLPLMPWDEKEHPSKQFPAQLKCFHFISLHFMVFFSLFLNLELHYKNEEAEGKRTQTCSEVKAIKTLQ